MQKENEMGVDSPSTSMLQYVSSACCCCAAAGAAAAGAVVVACARSLASLMALAAAFLSLQAISLWPFTLNCNAGLLVVGHLVASLAAVEAGALVGVSLALAVAL